MAREIVMQYWTLVDPAGDVAICQLVQTSHGLEVQCMVQESEQVLNASVVKTLHDAFNQSEAWRASYAAKGWRTGPGGS
jgi:hypothetical protein